MTDSIKDKVVVITGAGGRIVLGIARLFHAAGASVVLGDLHQDAVERAATDLGSRRAFAGTIDVRDETSTQSVFAAAERTLGPLTIALTNGGIGKPRAEVDPSCRQGACTAYSMRQRSAPPRWRS